MDNPVQDTTEKKVITAEYLDELKANRDTDGINKAIEQMTNPGATEEPVVEDQPVTDDIKQPGEDVVEAAEIQAPSVRKFETTVKGEKIEWDDDDHFLGYGSVGRVKKALIHKDYEIKSQKERAEKIRADAEAAVKRQLELEAQLKELNEKLGKQDAPEPKQIEVPTQPSQKIAKPVAPVEPDLPEDPMDWDKEARLANKKYKQERAEYEKQRDEYFESLVASKPAPTRNKELDDLRERVQKAEAIAKELADKSKTEAAEQARLSREKENNDYWKSLDKFRSDHKEYGDPEAKDILSIHGGILSWMDNLTSHFGVKKPYTPFDPQNPEWINYKREESDLVNRFLSDDPDLVKEIGSDKALMPPEGHGEYYDLLKLIQFKDKMVSEGELNEKASLHTAYLLKMDKDGTMNEGIKNIQVSAAQNANKNVLDALAGDFANNATQLPNEDSAGVPALTREDEVRILSMSVADLQKDPRLMKQHSEILKKLS